MQTMGKLNMIAKGFTSEKGFTIVELVIATLVFSTVILVVTGAIVRFTTNYQKALAQNTTQNAVRNIVDGIAESIQFKRDKVTTLEGINGAQGYCVGTARYSYMPYRELKQEEPDKHAFVMERNLANNCPPGKTLNLDDALPADSTELLSPNMRITKFNISRSSSNDLWTVTLRVVYGDDEVLCNPDVSGDCEDLSNISSHLDDQGDPNDPNDGSANITCKPHLGADFCAVSELSATLEPRL